VNFLYLHTHDSGRFLDPANSPVPLRGVERLAAAGVVFRNAFCAAPTCSPSRSALLTGTWPHENGMIGLAHRGFRLKSYSRHLARVFGAAGYETVLCGVQHEAPDRAEIGYERHLDGPLDYFTNPDLVPGEWDRSNAGLVADFLAEPHDRPFFLSFGLLETHRPFADPDARCPDWMHHAPPPGIPDTASTRRDMEGFVAALRGADQVIGRVLQALEQNALWEETVVLLTTDHGPPFPGMKCGLRDSGTGVSLLLRVPGVADDGTVIQSLVSHLDIYPTVCDLLGVPVPAGTRGRSLIPLLRGETSEVRHEVFAESSYHAVYEPMRSVRTERHKLIRRPADDMRAFPANVDDSPSKELMGEAGYFGADHPHEELYDLLLDPLEQTNLLSHARDSSVYRELSDLLDAWMEETRDPVREGRMPMPAGARVNLPEAWSPTEEAYE